MDANRTPLMAVLLVLAVVLLAGGCADCSCDPPGLTYLSTENFDEAAEAAYPFRIEVCIEDEACRTYSLPNDKQSLTISELGESQETPEMPDFTVRFLGSAPTTLSQNDFEIRTEDSSGCCAGYFHIIELRW
jgi:hypothetical protein